MTRRKPVSNRRAIKKSSGLAGEFFAMLRHNTKYWLVPLVVLIILGGSAAAPFVYTLF